MAEYHRNRWPTIARNKQVHGENAHSRYFSEDVYKKLKGGNKELLIVPGAVHTDLYDHADVIPFDRIEAFYREYMRL